MTRCGIRAALLVVIMVLPIAVTSAGCAMQCPGALLEGVLTPRQGDLVVVRNDGVAQPVNWAASNHSVRDEGVLLVVTDWLGFVKAREGDFVRLGGGEFGSGWEICGLFEVGQARGR